MERTLKQPAPAVLLPAIAITDGELLMRYARHGDEAAFAELVEKHGRLVWTVCWQVLRHHQEIEDAFQSTFFILAKRARSIRSCDSLCGWLYRVAYRTALRSRMAAKRKPVAQLVANELESLDNQLQAIEQCEQRAQLLEELHSLPEKYQQPLILCYLEGQSRRAIAEELGCSLETIKGRLARGRQMLRHRLICRGVSLSLAMGAMAVPVKSALAAVTPQLVGLTATGAAAWAAGAAKVSSTVSSQVIHLAHQGTVAMTIASFAKPAVLAVALLGAASATLAVNSSDQAPTAQGAPFVDLQADAEVAATSADDEEAIEIVVAKEVVAKEVAVTEKPRQPAPLRALQPPKNRSLSYPEVVIPTAQPVTPYYMPTTYPPVVQPIEVQLGALNVEANLKLRTHEAKVAELQLESKMLEIQSFDAKGEEKEALLLQSRKKLLMAEAEELRMQVERQKEEIKQLEKALKQQAEGLGRQVAQGAIQAQQFAQQPHVATTYLDPPPPNQPQEPPILQAGDQIKIEVVDAFPDRPINGVFTIEPTGTVALGASYGRVKVVDLTVIDAETSIRKHLKEKLVKGMEPQVQVTFVRR